ncbi:ATP-dependent nuclease [Tenacibaculum finnmarkense]|nr:TOPRIM nucleotidyl transferase/hydrolase domain-containing protein [Tenacibaculum finnmarkense]MCD8413676.1 AAA family ATPase [Tenacibaculum finnmarkense genomovar ulcerans]MCD8455230.1 AAA family ATPase [Tenacibaculum finnmarkense genomovar ulcerans]MCG8208377.1 AAA family ATPase [Tenacibaculum finnmarkense genomovar finnmarkense]MCG8724326.1 AAA family ATPase [Tenacibaculum finnmarkense]MCG8742645.1 AAA family ATPase [Tenacibaculum finnmarkense]
MKLTKLKLFNFKKFEFLEVDFKDNLNVIIGDNESGKSSILLAIDLALRGSRNRIETEGLDLLFNSKCIEDFFLTNTYETLPKLKVELYFDNLGDKDEYYGRNNTQGTDQFGLSLICEPRDELSKDISEILAEGKQNFPFEYYSIAFYKFSGQPYLSFRKDFKHILLDNTLINNEYATNQYIKTLYDSHVTLPEKNKHLNEYRKYKNDYKETILEDVNKKTGDYKFGIKNDKKSNLVTDLTITEENIDIQNKGKGRQCFIKTEFALQKNQNELDFILLEEPENHLSHLNMKNLITRIDDSENKQIFIATHSNLISSRLDLRNTILLNSNSSISINLSHLEVSTANFFMKAPDNNILEFILSKKVILVEGDAEFILLERFFEIITNKKPNELNCHIISVGGTSFKRYLEISKLLDVKTAVIRDNDTDYQKNCVDRYSKYISPNIKVFSETDNSISTFEISMFNTNTDICNDLFLPARITKSVQDFMLDEKADCAFELLDKKSEVLKVPTYIKEAIEWLIKN